MIVLVIFGPKRLPGLGRSLGQGMREFKDSIGGGSKDDDDRELEPAPVRASVDDREAAPAARAAGDQQAEGEGEGEGARSERAPVDGDAVPERRP